MLLPPPETVTTTVVDATPEGAIAMMTLFVIGCIVYGLSKIKFTYFFGVLVKTNHILRRQEASDASLESTPP